MLFVPILCFFAFPGQFDLLSIDCVTQPRMIIIRLHKAVHKLESVNVRKVSMVNECIFDNEVLLKVIPKLGIVRFPLPCLSREAFMVPMDCCHNHV